MAKRLPTSVPAGWRPAPPRPELAPGAWVNRAPRDLERVLGKLTVPGLAEDCLLARIDAFWAELVGPQIAGLAQVDTFSAGELRVKVSHPVWRTELSGLAEELRGRVNARLFEEHEDSGREAVRRLRFV
jgi:hypothetical protein